MKLILFHQIFKMKQNKKFDIVLNAIYDSAKRLNLNGMYFNHILAIPSLRELKENGELHNIIDLLCKDGYLEKYQISQNKSAPVSYSLTVKGFEMIEKNGFVWSKRKGSITFILIIISTIVAITSLIIQCCKST